MALVYIEQYIYELKLIYTKLFYVFMTLLVVIMNYNLSINFFFNELSVLNFKMTILKITFLIILVIYDY